MTKEFTVSELAALVAIRYLGDDKTIVMRQCRHWTTHGIIKPLGPLYVGTGTSRLYDLDAVYRAAVLVRLASAGHLVGVLAAFIGLLDGMFEKRPGSRHAWQDAIDGKGRVDLGLKFIRNVSTGDVVEAMLIIGSPAEAIKEMDHSAVPATWFNLSDLFRHINENIRRASVAA